MKPSEWSKMSKPLAAILPGFDPFKKGFIRRREWVVECIYADSSGYSARAFYLEAFALPLFVPTDHLYFNYGRRVGRRWEAVTDDLVRAVEASLPMLEESATLDGLLQSAARPQVDLHHAEIHFCVALICDHLEDFHRLAEEIAAWSVERVWERPIIERCAALTEAVSAEGLDAGTQVLRERAPGVLALFA